MQLRSFDCIDRIFGISDIYFQKWLVKCSKNTYALLWTVFFFLYVSDLYSSGFPPKPFVHVFLEWSARFVSAITPTS